MSSAQRLTARFDELGRAAAVCVPLTVDHAAARLSNAMGRRQAAWRADGERGAQAAEYAMLGGVAAAGCGTMVVVLNNQQDTIGEQVGDWVGKIFEFAGNFLG
jgi:Flp pilus assembly pilin Flp